MKKDNSGQPLVGYLKNIYSLETPEGLIQRERDFEDADKRITALKLKTFDCCGQQTYYVDSGANNVRSCAFCHVCNTGQRFSPCQRRPGRVIRRIFWRIITLNYGLVRVYNLIMDKAAIFISVSVLAVFTQAEGIKEWGDLNISAVWKAYELIWPMLVFVAILSTGVFIFREIEFSIYRCQSTTRRHKRQRFAYLDKRNISKDDKCDTFEDDYWSDEEEDASFRDPDCAHINFQNANLKKAKGCWGTARGYLGGWYYS